ncbi:metal-sensing transcriptional repressor [Alkalicella caledoniensis]|uniref:Metal-sensing transcriptional repressor n=1 Tax=Alkalicella caledoniensis TaxID=2731377 RepID=A0A7G9W9H3_ALKCA|nr:metal-sensing transcriptional repressor [Alkalicella caledoniensis]QNO15335.1 metal-sensing transcriptional repressor [Alkalicella caledoniensis]
MKQEKFISLSSKAKYTFVNGLNELLSFLKDDNPKILSSEEKEAIMDRLISINIQIDEIKSMVENDDDYSDIIKQIEYSRRALTATEMLLLESHSVPLQ